MQTGGRLVSSRMRTADHGVAKRSNAVVKNQ